MTLFNQISIKEPVQKAVNRLDFRKRVTAGVTVALVLSACQPPVVATSTPVPGVDLPNTPEVQEIHYEGTIKLGDEETEKSFLGKGTEFNADETIPIEIEVFGVNFHFVEAGKGNYFMEVNGEWKQLVSSEQVQDGLNLVVLQAPKVGESVLSEPVLWFPALTEEQWKHMTPEQKSQAWFGFAPPSEVDERITGYNRDCPVSEPVGQKGRIVKVWFSRLFGIIPQRLAGAASAFAPKSFA